MKSKNPAIRNAELKMDTGANVDALIGNESATCSITDRKMRLAEIQMSAVLTTNAMDQRAATSLYGQNGSQASQWITEIKSFLLA